ncbi:MAG: MFS transporter [Chloroflexota bacterium]|nr:MFS transporter [Chloroflexota bacterium]
MRIPVATIRSPADAVGMVRGVFYGWWLVGIAVVLLTLMALCVFQGLGTFLVALQLEFGWSRTVLSGAFSLSRAQGAVIGPIEGWLIDKVGNRRMILFGYLLMAFGFLMFSQVGNSDFWDLGLFAISSGVWQFYISFITISLGSGVGGWLALMALMNNWFVRQRSLAIATSMSGIHFGGLLVPVLALGIELYGFRWTTFGIAIFLAALILPIYMVLRDKPEDIGLLPDGARPGVGRQPERSADKSESQSTERNTAKPTAADDDDEQEFTAMQALRTRAFWILTVVHMSSSVSIVTLALHLAPKLTDMGMSLSGAGTIVLIYTVLALPTQFVAGWLADRMPKPPLIFFFILLQGVGIMLIAVTDQILMALVFAVLYGIGFGGRIPLLTSIRGEYFGRKAFATIMGLSQMPNNICMIFAPLFAGFMFDTTGTYFIPFAFFGFLNILGAFLMLTVKRPSMQEPADAESIATTKAAQPSR